MSSGAMELVPVESNPIRASMDRVADEDDDIEMVRDMAENFSNLSCYGKFCHILSDLTVQTILGVLLGFLVGVLIREAKPNSTMIIILGYFGELFIQALKMVVVPLIATGMVLAIVKLGDINKIKRIGSRALTYYLLTTFMGAIEGLVFVNMFNPGVSNCEEGGCATASFGEGAACKAHIATYCDSLNGMMLGEIVERCDNTKDLSKGFCKDLASLVVPMDAACTYEDFTNDLKSFPNITTVSDCEAQCELDFSCMGFNFPGCHLKNEVCPKITNISRTEAERSLGTSRFWKRVAAPAARVALAQQTEWCKTVNQSDTSAVAFCASVSSEQMTFQAAQISLIVQRCDELTNTVCPSLPKKETIDAFLDIGRTMLPPNIMQAYIETNIIGIIVFCLLLGFYLNKQEKAGPVLDMFEVMNLAFMEMVNLIIYFTPIGIGSLVCGQVVAQDDLWGGLEQVGLFVVTTVLGILFHMLVVYPTIYFLATRKNPFAAMKQLTAPMCTAFATSSSAATLPVTIKAVEKMGVHTDITRFMLPLGATINMDGSAIYFPIAVIFIGNWTGQGALMTFSNQITISVVSAFVSIGAAPIPSAGLVYLILIMNSVGVVVTGKVSLVLAIDWFLDRCQTMCNVTGDSMGANILEHYRKLDIINDINEGAVVEE